MATAQPTETVVVLVLGDVGRSPRMQYHALSLAAPHRRVLLMGYRGERCVPDVEKQPERIEQVLLSPDLIPRPRRRALYALYAPLKAVLQVLQLLWALLVARRRPDVLLVQTPPAIPTLAVAWFVRALGSKVVIDWHNLAFTIMEQSLPPSHPFLPVARRYERLFSRAGDAHLCVTAAMQAWLREQWGVEARVLHDRPPAFFRALEPQPRHELLRRLRPQFVDAHGAPLWADEAEPGSPWAGGGTPWSRVGRNGEATPRDDAPALLISSTSWTADEDFGLLLGALRQLDERLSGGNDGNDGNEGGGGGGARGASLRVVAVITGKGPLKAQYEEQMRQQPMARVAVCTMWLEPHEYPRLLGSASLGVCLHTSTSGLDLPMKVLDMLGCGLPVCAVGFRALPELITHGGNGLVFASAEELAEQLTSLVAPGEEAAAALRKLREGVAASEAKQPRWAENWAQAAAPAMVAQPPRLAARAVRYAAPLLVAAAAAYLAV